MINSNLGHILHRFWDTAAYWLKITNFSHPSLAQGDPCGIYEKALQIHKLESFRQPTVKVWWP